MRHHTMFALIVSAMAAGPPTAMLANLSDSPNYTIVISISGVLMFLAAFTWIAKAVRSFDATRRRLDSVVSSFEAMKDSGERVAESNEQLVELMKSILNKET